MPWVSKAQVVTIGDVTSNSAHYAAPIEQYYNYSFVEMLVPAAEIAAGQPTTNTIVSLGFYSPTGSNGYDYTITVYMKNVDASEFDATMAPVSNADVVFSGTITPETNAWTTLELDKAFIYDPTRALLVAVNKTGGQHAGPSYTWRYTATTANTVLMAHRDSYGAYTPTTSMPTPTPVANWQKTYRPNMQLGFGTPPSCEKPYALTVGSITGRTAELSWTSSASAWQLCLNDDESHLIDVATTSYTLQGLDPATTYTVKVRSKCSATSFSSWTSALSFTTEVTCPQPTGLAATLTSGDGTIATLHWTEAGDASDWVLEYGTASDFAGAFSVAVSGTPSITLNGLTAETTYYARVKSNCGTNDESIWSDAIAFTPTNDYFITVNDNITTTNGRVPVFGTWVDDHTRSQFILPASDLAEMQGNSINKLTFYGTVASNHPHWDGAQFEVYMAGTNSAILSALTDWSTMDKVMNTAHLEINDGMMTVVLDTPYAYTGGNLIIGFYQTVSGQYSPCSWQGVAAQGASLGGYGTTISQQDFLPKVTFYYSNDNVFIADGDWNNAANWSVGEVPPAGKNVVIRAHATIPADYVAVAGRVDIEEGGAITINEGGQLKHHTPGLEVTMKKQVAAYSGDKDHYQLLAFPFSNAVAVPVAMTAADGNDFYTFDNSMREEEWRNNKQVVIHSVSAFKGYLYANPVSIELSMTGLTYPSAGMSLPLIYTPDENYSSGWYLLGNPFTCDAYLYDENNAPVEVMFYDEEGEMTTLMAGPIPPLQGFFVKVSANTSVNFLPYRTW